MLAGATFGIPAAVETVVRRVQMEAGDSDMPVLMTGGAVPWLRGGLSETSRLVPDLTLQGIRLTYECRERV